MEMMPTGERPTDRAAGRRNEKHEGKKDYQPAKKFHGERQPELFIAQRLIRSQIKEDLTA